MKRFIPIIAVLLALVATACDSTTSSSTGSDVAKVTAFYLSNDSCESVSTIVFTVEEGTDVGHIYNIDSIAYGAPVDSLIPHFSFYTTPGAAVLYMPDTTVSLTGRDTLDWREGPDTLEVTSSDGTTVKRYRIDVNWHHADPDLYTWKRISSGVYESMEALQQLFILPDGRFSLYTNDGLRTRLFESADGGYNWTERTVSGLPADCRVRGIVALSDCSQFFYAADTLIYHSSDGASFSAYDLPAGGMRYLTALFTFPNNNGGEYPWLFVHNEATGTYSLAYFEYRATGEIVCVRDIPADNFPIDGFTSVRFASANERSRMMLFGGFDEAGRMVNSRWNWEYSRAVGVRITDYSIENPAFPRAANSSIVWYDDRLLMFGAVDSTYRYLGRKVYYSDDEGMNWFLMDTTKCELPLDEYSPRKNIASGVWNGNVYVVGGSDNTGSYSDVFVGRVNAIDWPRRH